MTRIRKVKDGPRRQPCPACGLDIKPPHASRSRYVQLYICSTCGTRESQYGFFWSTLYYKHMPTQSPDYNPFKVD